MRSLFEKDHFPKAYTLYLVMRLHEFFHMALKDRKIVQIKGFLYCNWPYCIRWYELFSIGLKIELDAF